MERGDDILHFFVAPHSDSTTFYGIISVITNLMIIQQMSPPSGAPLTRTPNCNHPGMRNQCARGKLYDVLNEHIGQLNVLSVNAKMPLANRKDAKALQASL